MSFLDMAGLIRRHVVATALVLFIAAIVGAGLKISKPYYGDTITLDLKTPSTQISGASTLVSTADLVTRAMMSPQAAQKVRAAGGSADYDVTMVNLYNLDFPEYSVPYVTVTVTARSQGAAQHTFDAVTRVLTQELQDWQANRNIPPIDQISLYPMASSGVVELSGSPTRTFATLLILTIIALFMVLTFLDRNPALVASARRLLRLPSSGVPRRAVT